MIHNNKVYADADNKFVKGVIVYAKSVNSNMTLYYDEECTKPVFTTELKDLFLNGVVIQSGDDNIVIPYLLYNGTLGFYNGITMLSFYATAPTEE